MPTKPTMIPRSTNDDVLQPDWNGQVLDKGRWEQEVLDGANPVDKIAALALVNAPTAHPNLLANGGFEAWNYTTSLDAVAYPNQMGPDGWQCAGATVVKDGGVRHSGEASMAIPNAPATGVTIKQSIPNAEVFRGLPLVFSGWVRGPGTGSIYVEDGTNTYASPVSGGGAGWERLVAAGTVGASCTRLTATFGMQGAGSVNLDSFVLTATPGIVSFIPRTPAEEARACARYRQIIRASYRFYAPTGAGGVERQYVNFNPPFAVTPAYIAVTFGTRANLDNGWTACPSFTRFGANLEYRFLSGGSTGPGDAYAFDDQFVFDMLF